MKKVIQLLLPGIAMIIFAGLSMQTQAQEKTKEKEALTFIVVEDMPTFQTGDFKSFNTWVSKNVKYPKEALKNGISGKVRCEFVVTEKGGIDDVKITESINKLLDDEVIRVIKSSTGWTAGLQKGVKVRVKMSIPVDFKLDSKPMK